MITLRRSRERLHEHSRKRECWSTFPQQNQSNPVWNSLSTLEDLDESHIPPRAETPGHPDHDCEILTYVRTGELSYEDSLGRSGVIQAGEFQVISARRDIRRSDTNSSRTHWAQVFQIRLRPSEDGLEPGLEQQRFSVAERRGRLCMVASPEGRSGSLAMHQDALLYSALLGPGQHVVHEISQGRTVWLHLVQGEATLSDLVLATGDGAGVGGERAVSLTAREDTEILLLDLGKPPHRSTESGIG